VTSPFETFLSVAIQQGIFAFYLPFLLVLTLFFGLLEKTQPFGGKSRHINLIVSFVAAMYVLIFNQTMSMTITTFFAKFFTETSLALVTLLVGLMIVGLLGGPALGKEGWEQFGKKIMGAVLLIAVIVGFFIFSSSGGFELFGQVTPGIGFGLSEGDIVLIAFLALTVLAIWYMTKGDGGEK
jgi:hypothetical protein